MKWKLVAVAAVLLGFGREACAHRIDEYLQATILSVEKQHVQASMRLIPGITVSSSIIASIDRNGDGVFSEAEERAYAERVLSDLSLSVDGHAVRLKLTSWSFPQIEPMREGLGEIHLAFMADLPPGGYDRRLVLENRHQNKDSAYLVNTVVPREPEIQVVAQRRNEQQSLYELDYRQSGGTAGSWWTAVRVLVGGVGFISFFRLGMRHIAEGTDHLLFLLALLLPAPLVVHGTRWGGSAGVRRSVLRILKIVTAFTVGHSLTLALAAFEIVHVPSRLVEVQIAVSILISAIHALRPIFPGKRRLLQPSSGSSMAWPLLPP